MAERSYPALPLTGGAEWQTAFLAYAPDRVVSGLGVTAGSGRDVLLAAGFARVGGMAYENTATKTLTSSVNVSTNARIDVLVLGLNWSGLAVTAYVKEGIPAATPVAQLTTRTRAGTWEVAVAQWTVPGSSGTTNSGLVNLDPRIRQEVELPENLSGGLLVPGAAEVGISARSLTVLSGSLIDFQATVNLKTAANSAGYVYARASTGKANSVRWHSHDYAQIVSPRLSCKFTARVDGAVSVTIYATSDLGSSAGVAVLEVPVVMREILA